MNDRVQPSRQDLDEQVQGLALTGFSLPRMRTFLLEVKDPAKARQFVTALVDRDLLDFGGKTKGEKPDSAASIGFTYEGLRALGTPAAILEVLKDKSPAFGEGAHVRAGRYLGDAGVSAPDRWDEVFKGKSAHVWIAVHGDASTIEASCKDLRGLPGATGLHGWDREKPVPEGVHISGTQKYANGSVERNVSLVHFGFRDNITKPSIIDDERQPMPPPPALGDPVKPQPGELLIGYGNNARADVWTEGVSDKDLVAFLRNGSFGVLRQIQQNEGSFRDYLDAQSQALKSQGYDFVSPAYLQAKLCGRWANGAPVTPHATEPPAGWDGKDGAFDFSQDKDGTGCPFGAHARRANPRGDLMPQRDRTVFRRGMPYGARYEDKPTDAEPRGLVGVFFCGRIDDQFEMLVSEWLEKNPLGPPNKGRAKDPLSGNHDEPDAGFHIPLNGGSGFMLKDFRTFVRTRGTLYALFPSLRALNMIASGKYEAAP